MRTYLRTAILILLLLLPVLAFADTTPPTITSVNVSPGMAAVGDTIHITVTATDDTEVTVVRANTVALSNTETNTWEGDIAVDPVLGIHSVSVIARDAANNTSEPDTSAEYRTAQIVGIPNEKLYHQVAINSKDKFLFQVWGKAAYISSDSFSLDDGGKYATTIDAPGHSVSTGSFIIARGILDTTTIPYTLRNAKYQASGIEMHFNDVSVGKDLEALVDYATLAEPAPAGGLNITITSTNPNLVLLSTSPTEPGTDSIQLNMTAGATAVPSFYVHSLADTGSVDIQVAAPGSQGDVFKANLSPSGFIISNSTGISTSVYSANTGLTIRSYRLNQNMSLAESQRVRGGLTVVVDVSSNDVGVGDITLSPLSFEGGDLSKNTAFDPIAVGTCTVSVSAPGFSTPSTLASIPAVVTAGSITATDAIVGKDLQTPVQIYLSTTPPAPVDVTVTVETEGTAIVSKSQTTAGTKTVTFNAVSGTSVGTVYIQGIAEGTTKYTVTASGYGDATKNINIHPSGFVIVTNNINTTSFSANTQLDIRPYRLVPGEPDDPGTNAPALNQQIRGGLSVSVPVSTNNPAVGVITASPLSFNGGDTSKTTYFDPVGAGTCDIAVSQPVGFTAANSKTEITATVTAPAINTNPAGGIFVGEDLQVPVTITLAQAPTSQVDVTVIVDSTGTATLSKDKTLEGTSTVVFTGITGTSVGTIYVQGRALGTTVYHISAPGYATSDRNITVDPSGFCITSPTSINTTSLAANVALNISACHLSATTKNYVDVQQIRGGLTVNVPVTSDNTGVGTITISPVTLTGGDTFKATAFDPVSSGTAIIAAGVPAGFDTPGNKESITATITQPTISTNPTNINVGKDLQTSVAISLSIAPPTSRPATVTVADTNIATISKNSTTAGSGTATFTNVSSTSVGTIYVQGLAIGTTTMTITIPGYADLVRTITIDPSGFCITDPVGSFTTTSSASNKTITVTPCRLDSTTNNYAAMQSLRAGLSASVIITSSNTSVGTITTSPLSFTGGSSAKTTYFDPIAAGTSTIAVQTPAGFTTPNNRQSVVATVN